MDHFVVSEMAPIDNAVEVVERKGLGHPDTICDGLAEAFSRALCREYRRRFGDIFHHNVDKALLWGGRAIPQMGGGEVVSPINVYLAGRATAEVGAEHIPIEEIAVESSRSWLRGKLHALDPERHVRINVLTRPVSQDLQALFARSAQGDVPLCNDTSIGVGHAPLSRLEQLVLAIDKQINGRDRSSEKPAWGEDIKIMAIRSGEKLRLTIACAMVGRYLVDIDDYLCQKAELQRLARDIAAAHGFRECEVDVNNADRPASGNIYLTVTGTSAEAGDDGQVGRGNRVNGLITPCRPMSLEAVAGKNPASHIGKIYSVLSRQVAQSVVAEVKETAHAECLIVGQIGAPINDPAIVAVNVVMQEGCRGLDLRNRIEAIAADRFTRIRALADDFVNGTIELF
ncbi:methionine adenosyltransferase [Bradyrhizobium sediminis]|uniref:Methionine adenosyltransferase n=1 Tax=Bradyrhizobium sediminis TaxID=2840469 RepID=A0A975NEL9_9BRAD|nr:methionine adenosyltransferase [Bradyrhizobium sediminis]QWG13151.1 methionine adenosyltransferase [Bradyrhizobium sediminis]